MKIAQMFEYFGDGGAEAQAFLLAKKIRDAGDSPILLVSRFSMAAQQKVHNEGIEYFYLPMSSSFNPIKIVKAVLRLRKLVDEQQIRIIHTHMLREQSICIATKLIGVKFILVRTFHRFDQFNWKMKPLMFLYRMFTDAFISISDEMTRYLNRNGIKDKVNLIYNGVEKVEVGEHQPAIGFIGRLAKEKHVFDFIEANKEMLKSVKMVIAGDGPEFNLIKKLVDNNNLDVELMGNVSDKAEFFKKISVLVLPSETEVMPMVVLEAYSCGLPVVAFKLDSLKDIVNPTNGGLIDYADYVAMAETAREYINTIDYYASTNINEYNQKYSVDIMWANVAGLYRKLYNAGPGVIK